MHLLKYPNDYQVRLSLAKVLIDLGRKHSAERILKRILLDNSLITEEKYIYYIQALAMLENIHQEKCLTILHRIDRYLESFKYKDAYLLSDTLVSIRRSSPSIKYYLGKKYSLT